MPEDKEQLKRSRLNNGWLERKERRSRGWSAPWLPSPREKSREETLVNFVGEERAPEVLAALRPEAQNAGQLVDVLLGGMDLSSKVLLNRLARNWSEMVGVDNEKICRPLQIEGDTLYIEVISSGAMYVINMQKVIIGRRIFDFSSGVIKRVQLRAVGTNRRG